MVEEADQPGAERGKVGTRHPHDHTAPLAALHDGRFADLAHHRGGAQPVHGDQGLGRVALTELLGIVGHRGRDVEAGRHLHGPSFAHLHVAFDAVDAVGLPEPGLVLEPDDVPEPVAGEEPVGIDRARAAAVAEAHRSPPGVGVEQHRQGRQRREGGHEWARFPLHVAGAELEQREAPGVATDADGGDRQLEGLALVGRQAEVGQLVAGPVDPVGRGPGPVPLQHLLLDGHAEAPQLGLVPLEGPPPGRLALRVLADQLVGDLLERQRLGRLQQQRQEVDATFERVSHAREG